MSDQEPASKRARTKRQPSAQAKAKAKARQAALLERVRARQFRPLIPSRLEFLDDRWRFETKQQPRLRALRRRLLALGGLEVVPRADPDLDLVLARGELFDGRRPQLRPDRESDCHANVARLWRRAGEAEVRIVTGWALARDGLWRQHSWALDPRGRVIETTEKRILYFGVVLAAPEAAVFAHRMLRGG